SVIRTVRYRYVSQRPDSRVVDRASEVVRGSLSVGVNRSALTTLRVADTAQGEAQRTDEVTQGRSEACSRRAAFSQECADAGEGLVEDILEEVGKVQPNLEKLAGVHAVGSGTGAAARTDRGGLTGEAPTSGHDWHAIYGPAQVADTCAWVTLC